MRFLTTLLITILISSPWARAEYRAYELRLDNTEKGTSRTVISTLDHLQYPRYYPLAKGEVAAYVDSWRCRENMSHFRKTCPKPDRAAASAAPITTLQAGTAGAEPKPNSK